MVDPQTLQRMSYVYHEDFGIARVFDIVFNSRGELLGIALLLNPKIQVFREVAGGQTGMKHENMLIMESNCEIIHEYKAGMAARAAVFFDDQSKS